MLVTLVVLAAALAGAAERPPDRRAELRGRPAPRPSGPAAKLGDGLRARRRPAAHARRSAPESEEEVAVVVRLREVSAPVLQELAARGLAVERVAPEFGTVEGRAAPADLERIAEHDAVSAVREAESGFVRAGTVTTQGDAAARLDEVRAAGLDGSGVTVGILSDGLGGLAASQASGDLPAVSVPADARCRAGTGSEGTAVLEIVHDVAPGAQLLFASGVASPLTFVEALRCLVDAGARVIVDDIGFFTEPYFEDGVVASAAREAVEAGVSLHTAAGNSARLHLEEDFRTSPDDFHDFLAGAGLDNLNGIVVGAGGRVSCALQWDERFGYASDDYDLELRDADTLEILAASRNVQNGSQDPLELVRFTNSSAASRTLGVAVQRIAGGARRLKLFCFGSSTSGLQYGDPAGSIVGHPGVPGVLAVGAIDVADPGRDTLEAYSSHGPARIRFPTSARRDKPDLVAFDGIATSVPGFGAFFGTSAAAPHSAGLAALLLQRNPLASGAELFAAITGGAVDLGAAGFDTATGFGRLDGPGALARFTTPECVADADCADMDPCTSERCEAGTCVRAAPCDDGDPCNGREVCDAASGTCRPGSALGDGTSCGDGDVCNGREVCRAGECRAGHALACRDDDACTVDACDPRTGCVFPPAEAFDGVGCTFERPLPTCPDEVLPHFVSRRFKRAARRVERAARASKARRQRRRLLRAARVLEGGMRRLQKKVDRGRLSGTCAEAVAARFAEPAMLARALADRL